MLLRGRQLAGPQVVLTAFVSAMSTQQLKEQLKNANKKFKNGIYQEAIEAYGDIIVDERLSATGVAEEASGDILSSGKVYDDKFQIRFDAHLNRSACLTTIGEYELAAADALKCKEMNRMSIKAYARLAAAYQGSGDHLGCIKECEEGLKIRESDIALRQIWMTSDKELHPENYHVETSSPLCHDHSHGHSHSHGYSHDHGHQPSSLSKSGSGSCESDVTKSQIASWGSQRVHREPMGRKTPTGAGSEISCLAKFNEVCCLA